MVATRSRLNYCDPTPKQLLALTSNRTMLQETAAGVSGIADVGAPLVVCNEAHRFLLAEQSKITDLQSRRSLRPSA